MLAKLTPMITEFTGKVSKAVATVFATMIDILSRLTAKFIEVLKENSAELQKFFSLFADFVKGKFFNTPCFRNKIIKINRILIHLIYL